MYDIFYVSKSVGNDKDWNNIKIKYPTAQRLSNITSYNQIESRAFTKMFWVIWDDIILNNEFNLTEYIATSWDNMYVHVFKNSEYFDGLCLFSKEVAVTKKEFDYRFFMNKKEIDIIASCPRPFEIYNIKTYDDYLKAKELSPTEMFWALWDDIDVTEDFKFDYYVPIYDAFHRNITHVFKNGKFFDGICLFSKEVSITKKEFDHRFFTNKKEIDIVASVPKQYDIVFISYNEPIAEENYKNLLKRFPRVKRVHGVTGIHQAHIAAAKLAETHMFWAVDGDAEILEDFNFDHEVPTYEKDIVHVWCSKNPINDLVYGYGGVKLLPRKLTVDLNITSLDMTTSISKKFKSMSSVSNITIFNTDEFSTWRSAFRECCKLASRSIERQFEQETQQRLDVWCSEGKNKPFGEYAIAGAIAGRQYGHANQNNLEALKKINDYIWMKGMFSDVK